jgi:hypothetical protein
MNRQRLVALAAGLAVLLALAFGLTRRSTDEPAAAGKPLYPGLAAQLNEVTGVTVTGPDGATVATLKRRDAGWVVAERDDYPADVTRLRKLLLAIADAQIVEEKTSTPELYGRLGVADPGAEVPADSAPEPRGTLVRLAGPEPAVSVVVGRSPPGSSEFTWVRRAGEAASWMVSGRIEPGRSVSEFLDRTVTKIPVERMANVSITHPGGSVLRIAKLKPDDPNFSVLGLSPGQVLTYPGAADPVAGVLADLQLDDVTDRGALGDAPGKPVLARFTTTDGLTVEASTWSVPAGQRVTFTASGTESTAAEAKALNDRLGGRVYHLPTYQTEQLTRRLSDLLVSE